MIKRKREQKSLKESLLEKVEALGWWYDVSDDGSIEIGKHSPAGEDFFFDIEGKDIVAEVQEYYEYYDPDEHAKMWVEAMGRARGVPQSVRTLIDDADAIDDKLMELKEALEEMEAKLWTDGQCKS